MDKSKARVSLMFHGSLRELVRRRVESEVLVVPLARRTSIKDLIEAHGVPHTEAYGLTADGQDVDFSHIVLAGQRFEIHPASPPLDPLIPTRLRPRALPSLRFLVDVNVGKLAMLLRLIDLDASTRYEADDAELARLAHEEGRFLLSGDRGLMRRSLVEHGRLIRANEPRSQFAEVLRLFGLRPPFRLFQRCLRCNLPLEAVPKAEVASRLKPKTKRYYDQFSRCPGCERVYWPGSHYERMLGWLNDMLADLRQQPLL